MEGSAAVSAEQAVSRLSAATQEPFVLVGRLSGGETGAYEVAGPSGRRLVMKWDLSPLSAQHRREAVDLTARLRRDAGWPVPEQWTIDSDGCLFVLQEYMSGASVDVLGHGIVDRLLSLHAARVGLAGSTDPSDWPHGLIATLTVGGEGYCRHESLRTYSQQTADLLVRIKNWGGTLRPADLDGRDIVHCDLHPGNLLQADGQLSAIVDTDFVKIGDAAFDLVVLALTSLTLPCEPGVRSRLFSAGFDGLSAVRRRTYLGHLFIRFLDWSIQRDNREEVDFWLAQESRMREF
jgi:phosphotransferase family enzyme